MERIIALKPDLLVAWPYISSERQLQQLRQLGIPIFYIESHKLDDIPDSLVRLGQLLGTESQAQQAAAKLRGKLSALAAQYGNRPKLRVFYQVWHKPLYTLNGQHIVSDALHLCGGENIFAGLKAAAPVVSIEAVLRENPDVIISSSEYSPPDGGINLWKPYSMLTAVRRNNLMTINGNLLNRAGPRMVDGTAALCEKLEQARQHRKTMP
jgi:iron complex transport system substrate-binding protein